MHAFNRPLALLALLAAARFASALPVTAHDDADSPSATDCASSHCVQSVFNAAGEPPLRLAYVDRLSARTVSELRRSNLAGAYAGLRPGEVLKLTVLTDPGLGGDAAQSQWQHRADLLRARWRAAGLPAARLKLIGGAAPPAPVRAPTAR